MQTIVQLSPDVISKIAAGEVIERPSYAVKELIDNAIDAGASLIEVHIEESGLRKIQVIDNGCGMNKEDVAICFLPHTTSKLKNEEELVGIKTLGFRGEALSSIAAISSLAIKSRRENSSIGTRIEIKEGKIDTISPVGAPVGTNIIVENLFYSVPARKKFLKSLQTEFRLITDIVMHFALHFSDIHFVLTHNKRQILNLPKKTIKERMHLLFGKNMVEQLISFKSEDGYMKLYGLLGKPHSASKNNQRQFIFVNNRFIKDKLISLAVKEAYGTLLSTSHTPIFVINITMPHEMVDVNVHPRKDYVAFVNGKVVFDAVKQAVTHALTENNITFKLSKFNPELDRSGETTSLAGELLKQAVLPQKGVFRLKNPEMLQVHDMYIFVIAQETVFFIDQHAAHERILYEQFLHEFQQRKQQKEVHILPKPLSVHLSLNETQVLEEYKNQFTDSGFKIEPLQENTFIIRAVPLFFKGRNIEKIIKDMIEDFVEKEVLKSVDSKSERMLAFLACRGAFMAGEKLNLSQMKKIVNDLEKTNNNATCPHGRPTKIELPLKQLHAMFRR